MYGVLSSDNEDLTYRELYERYFGKEKADWTKTAFLCCLYANSLRDPKKQRRPFTIEDFMPDVFRENKNYSSGKGTPLNMQTVHLFKNLLDSVNRR